MMGLIRWYRNWMRSWGEFGWVLAGLTEERTSVMSKAKEFSIRSDITEFSAAMEFEMAENDEERGDSWKEEDLDFMIGRIHEEIREINRESDNLNFEEMDKKRLASVMREAADAGNFSMMIWCQCRDQLKSRP